MRKTLTVVAMAALYLFSGLPARAQDAATVNHVLKSTLFDGGQIKAGFLNKAGVFVFANSVSFKCTTACTLEVEIMEEVGNNKTAKNFWDICAEVDGGKTATPCIFQGTLPTDSSFVIGNYLWSVPLPAGAHTAEPEVGVAAPATIANFHITYHIYQP
jgi:hypothetical protein